MFKFSHFTFYMYLFNWGTTVLHSEGSTTAFATFPVDRHFVREFWVLSCHLVERCFNPPSFLAFKVRHWSIDVLHDGPYESQCRFQFKSVQDRPGLHPASSAYLEHTSNHHISPSPFTVIHSVFFTCIT